MTEPDEGTGPNRSRRWAVVVCVVALLGEMAAAMVTAAVQQTPTVDEPVYVGAAVVYQREHSLRYNPEHPPLGKLVMGAGLAVARPRLAEGRPGTQEAAGRRLLYESGNDAQGVLLAARIPVIVLTLLFGLVVFAFATDLTGAAGGLVALALYAFSPDVIAHGSLATLDVPASGFLLTSVWTLWRARDRPLPYLPLAAVALGAAVATRMSMLAAVPVLVALALCARPSWRGRVGAALGMAAGTVAVVWACYLAVDPRLRWTTPANVPNIGGTRALLVDLMPFPRPYRDGMRVQFGFEDSTWSGFLFGRHYRGSLWYYLPAALLVKTPLATLALWTAGTAVMVVRRAALHVLLPVAVLSAAAMTGSRDLGVRYVIFVPMFLAVAAATVTTLRPRRWATAALIGLIGLIGFVAVSSLRTFPYYLPYSNEAFGGPSKTHLRLHDSNVDWGQDLGRLADRLRARYPDERIWLSYKGSGVPSYYGIHAGDPFRVPPDQVRGLVVVSDGWIAKADPRLTALLRGSEPIDEVGHSITIFRRPAAARD